MRIAFYAPLKPPDHPVPSGDRRVAQLFFEAVRLAGHEPLLASRFRSYDVLLDAVSITRQSPSYLREFAGASVATLRFGSFFFCRW